MYKFRKKEIAMKKNYYLTTLIKFKYLFINYNTIYKKSDKIIKIRFNLHSKITKWNIY